jgi:hypothetical protein
MAAPVGTGRALGVAMSVMEFDGLSTSEDSTVGFYGVTRVAQPANAAQAALTLTTATTGGVGFSTATAFSAMTAQLENIRASLVLLGLLKGSA